MHHAARHAGPVANAAGKALALAAVLVSMFAFLGGCGARTAREYHSSHDGLPVAGDAGASDASDDKHTFGASSISDDYTLTGDDTASDAGGSEHPSTQPAPNSEGMPDAAPTRPQDVVSNSGDETSELAPASSSAPVLTTEEEPTEPATCNPTSDDCGRDYCTPSAAQCVTRTDARDEGAVCTAHEQCAAGHACGFIGDPGLRQLACLRLGRSDQDCGGALGRIKFGVGLTALVDDAGAELGLCIGDIR